MKSPPYEGAGQNQLHAVIAQRTDKPAPHSVVVRCIDRILKFDVIGLNARDQLLAVDNEQGDLPGNKEVSILGYGPHGISASSIAIATALFGTARAIKSAGMPYCKAIDVMIAAVSACACAALPAFEHVKKISASRPSAKRDAEQRYGKPS
jgi:hypothetical protein